MATRNILEECRAALGLTDGYFDDQIALLIEAARKAMWRGGVGEDKANDDSDPMVIVCITCFVKAMIGNDNPDAEKYMASFDSMVSLLKMSRTIGE